MLRSKEHTSIGSPPESRDNDLWLDKASSGSLVEEALLRALPSEFELATGVAVESEKRELLYNLLCSRR